MEFFLSDLPHRPLDMKASGGINPAGLFVGQGEMPLEVAVAHSSKKPAPDNVSSFWRKRRDGRAAPVLLVVLHGRDTAALCGPAGEKPPVRFGVDRGKAERLCREALRQPDHHAARRFLDQVLPSLETPILGISNQGLLALHELTSGRIQQRSDWKRACESAKQAAGSVSEEMLKALGFQLKPIDNLTQLLSSNKGRRTALAILLNKSESPDSSSERFNNLTPISYALNKADSENLPWVIMVQDNRIRIYPTDENTGIGRRGRTQTFVDCHPSLLDDQDLGYLWLIFSADALQRDGSLYELLEDSGRFAGDLAQKLRERIYNKVIPALADGVVEARAIENPSAQDLRLTYEMVLTILFRLLFIAYAEDRDLLPYKNNALYQRRSLKQKAQELAEIVREDTPIAVGDEHWKEVNRLWKAVEKGNTEWGVPEYNGGLFSTDKNVSEVGHALSKISLPNKYFESALRELLLSETAEGPLGPVDFRSLGVREFGTIYEGLLESELSLAELDLALVSRKGEQFYEPVRGSQEVAVAKGKVYLHNKSGARKASGSYYTKPFAVNHLLDKALKPMLEKHFDRLDDMDDTEAAKAFFDFRVADISMGSGHFLITAVDYIERGMTDYLARRRLPGVLRELDELRKAALKQLEKLDVSVEIEDASLLRRLIAKRCIYGVDVNGLAVQLATLAVWIHTFVPGLPLFLLDHNLVLGDALVGVGSKDEMKEVFSEGARQEVSDSQASFQLAQVGKLVSDNFKKVEGLLKQVAICADATISDIEQSRQAWKKVEIGLDDVKAIYDIIFAKKINPYIPFHPDDWDEKSHKVKSFPEYKQAQEALSNFKVLHFPLAFPWIFMREGRSGFDVILGNPPWEEATLEEHAFWARHFPGLRALSVGEMKKNIQKHKKARKDLVAQYDEELESSNQLREVLKGYPGMGTGDPDLYKAFCWRFWQLSNGARSSIGVVLPRSVLTTKGSTEFRKTVFEEAGEVDVTTLLNSKGWIFPEVHFQFPVALTIVERGEAEKGVLKLSGSCVSLDEFEESQGGSPASFSLSEVIGWNDTASLPLFPSNDAAKIFFQMCKAPRLDFCDDGSWRVRPVTELHATADKPLMDIDSKECPKGYWPVFGGKNFDLWNPNTDEKPYAYASLGTDTDPSSVMYKLFNKRKRSRASRGGAYHEFSTEYVQDHQTLPFYHPRIVFRDVTNPIDRRTCIACLLPASVFLTNTAPYFLWPRGDAKDQAFLLGVLCSIPLDWYARCVVQLHMNFHIVNAFPIPRPSRDDALWRRGVVLAGRLACPDERFAAWAKEVGVKCGPLKEDEKSDMIYELDAVVAHLYGLSEKRLVHIFETFRKSKRWDYQDRLEAVRKHYKKHKVK